MSKRRKQRERARQIRKARQTQSSTNRRRSSRSRAADSPEVRRVASAAVWGGIAAVLVVAAIAIYYFAVVRPNLSLLTDTLATEEESMTPSQQWTEAPAMALTPGVDYSAILRTEKGDIHVDLFQDETPITVNNFVFLTRSGYYDNVTFHRVLPGFMAQTGDPTGTGSGGPGYTFPDEFVPTLRHDSAGTLSMANRGTNTNGSQFFITYAPTPHLDNAHTVFGRVTEGMDVLESLTPRNPAANPNAPAGDRIITIEIIEQ
jgi:cyclophilin family peptidyl-prolyl cis-trans isomerase